MLIHGKERKFKLTVGAAIEIAALCPDKDLRNIGAVLDDTATIAERTDLTAGIIVALNRGYEQARSYEEPGYAADPITRDEILSLDMKALVSLRGEAFAAFLADSQVTVEAEPAKKKG